MIFFSDNGKRQYAGEVVDFFFLSSVTQKEKEVNNLMFKEVSAKLKRMNRENYRFT